MGGDLLPETCVQPRLPELSHPLLGKQQGVKFKAGGRQGHKQWDSGVAMTKQQAPQTRIADAHCVPGWLV